MKRIGSLAITSPQVKLYRAPSSPLSGLRRSRPRGVCHHWPPRSNLPNVMILTVHQFTTSVRRVKKWFWENLQVSQTYSYIAYSCFAAHRL
ncbi:MAG: hypothetical protein ACTS5A_03110 [Candidatus Hodgkinia cicadicola]